MIMKLLYPNGKEKALTLSYDDVSDHNIKLIEFLEKFNVKCTFNLNASRFNIADEKYYCVSPDEIKKIYDNPLCEVATHSYTHSILTQLPKSKCMLEILKDRQVLERLFNRIIRGHAYAGGYYNDEVVDTLKQAGIVYARTVHSHRSFGIPTDWMRWAATCHHNDPELMNLADKFINDEVGNSDGWLFYLWGHAFEFSNNNNWNVIEGFFQKVANNDNVWYATNMEVYDYVTAYKSLVYSADGDLVYNPTLLDVWFKIDGETVFVPAGQTVNI